MQYCMRMVIVKVLLHSESSVENLEAVLFQFTLSHYLPTGYLGFLLAATIFPLGSAARNFAYRPRHYVGHYV